jgi:cyclic pyranopterin phosphate synthase
MDSVNKGLSHLDEEGDLHMVDVGSKAVTHRTAKAICRVRLLQSTLSQITSKTVKKGDVFVTAKVAGIFAAKRVHELIPLCHPLPVDHVDVHFVPDQKTGILTIHTEVSVHGRTGAEMEALQAAAQAALTVYDMCKSLDREMVIYDLALVEKTGGKSGTWERE